MREPVNIAVLVPLCDDWAAVEMLLADLRNFLGQSTAAVRVFLIDDASTQLRPEGFARAILGDAFAVTVITLKRNLGHQRALAIGIAHVAERDDGYDAVVVMDSDGEDAPGDVPRLLQRLFETEGKAIVFAERTQRSENLVFRGGYFVYRHLHRLLTGNAIRFGNFSVIPGRLLGRIASISEIWNHYAAAVVKARLPVALVKTARARRLTGESKMNFTGLVIHGLSAISVYGETIGVKLLLASVASLALLFAAGLAVLFLKAFTDMAIPGWASTAVGLLAVIFIQMAALSLQFAFLVLQSRAGASFIPSRDHGYFIESVESIV
jgi:glycosyltransferase involved in cell wall biosynthesis